MTEQIDWKMGRARRLNKCAIGSVVILPTLEIITVKPGHLNGCYNADIVFYVADAINKINERVCSHRATVLKRYLEWFEIEKSCWIYDIILMHFKEIADNTNTAFDYHRHTGRLFITMSHSVAVPRVKW